MIFLPLLAEQYAWVCGIFARCRETSSKTFESALAESVLKSIQKRPKANNCQCSPKQVMLIRRLLQKTFSMYIGNKCTYFCDLVF